MDGYISEAQHEKEMTRIETTNKRWFILCMVLVLMLVGTNAAWIIYESQYQDIVITQEVDNDGGDPAVFGVGVGDVNYGEGASGNQSAR